MADIDIEVDSDAILALLEALGPAAEVHVHEVSKVTAERIQQEARARSRRATGVLHAAITVEEVGPPMFGYRVFVGEMSDARGRRPREFALWHEYGTEHMKAQPFMGAAARLEEGPHLRRIADALMDAVFEVSE
jgi:hypothetical protein